jgi:UPF0716 protein FxsA
MCVGCLFMLLLIAWPIAELHVLFRMGRWLGLPMVLLLLVLSALLGAALMRRPGLGVAARARKSWAQGVVPARELFDALCLLCAGFLLLVPGFLSDGVGLLLLLPPVRTLLFAWATARMVARVRVYGGGVSSETAVPPAGSRPRRPSGDVVIDAEWEEVHDAEAPDDTSRTLQAPADPAPTDTKGGVTS